jgi:dTDP-4-amino-4,6-dideoxygalactose transaminase
MSKVAFLDLGAGYRELKEELDEATARVMASGWYIGGPEVDAFEGEFAAYCGVEHCIGVGNGLNALELVLRAWEIGPGDEVIVPSNTYIASWLAVTAVGATVVPVEPDPATSNLDAARVEAAVTDRTRAIMPVHLYGQCVEMGPIMELAERRGLRVLEDAAQAHGARYEGRRAGGLGHAAAWSFYPSKNLGAYGDGGAVTTGDAELAAQVRLIANYGSRRKYYNEVAGTNSRLDPLQAALLRVRLAHLDPWNARRAAAAARYTEAFDGLGELRLPSVPDWSDPVWHVYAIHHPDRDRLQAALAEQGVQTLIFYPVPPHLSGAYAHLGMPEGAYPLAEELARTTLGLPIGPQMTEEEQERVIAAVRFAASPAATI